MRGATVIHDLRVSARVSIHAPRARGDAAAARYAADDNVSIHAPRARGDKVGSQRVNQIRCFNSRPSCEGRHSLDVLQHLFIVSIHAPRARGDDRAIPLGSLIPVSIHAPRARGDERNTKTLEVQMFQFTPLVRGATASKEPSFRLFGFNSRPSCEGRPMGKYSITISSVSIHAPRARGDVRGLVKEFYGERFNSRPSCEGRRQGA